MIAARPHRVANGTQRPASDATREVIQLRIIAITVTLLVMLTLITVHFATLLAIVIPPTAFYAVVSAIVERATVRTLFANGAARLVIMVINTA